MNIDFFLQRDGVVCLDIYFQNNSGEVPSKLKDMLPGDKFVHL